MRGPEREFITNSRRYRIGGISLPVWEVVKIALVSLAAGLLTAQWMFPSLVVEPRYTPPDPVRFA